MKNQDKRPIIGLGVIILKGDTILFGKRKSTLEKETWCIPGGHLDYGEELEEGAEREVAEETGLTVKNIRFGTVINSVDKASGKHYVSLTFVADYDGGEPQILEPDKINEWQWFDLENLPSPMCIYNKKAFDAGFDPRQT